MVDVVTTGQAAQLLGVHPSRVRALVASGALTATRSGTRWLIDADSLDRHADLVTAGATGRPFASHTAWAAAALCDGMDDQLRADDRYRLRNRLVHAGGAGANTCAQMQRWLSRRATSVHRYRIADRDLKALLVTDGVMATGISAADTYRLGLATGGSADAYVSDDTRRAVVDEFVLIDSERGNLTLRVTDADIHQAAVAPRLIAGVDLAEGTDARTHAAGCALIDQALSKLRR